MFDFKSPPSLKSQAIPSFSAGPKSAKENIGIKKCTLETMSTNSSASTASNFSNASNFKGSDFILKEKNYVNTIDKLQKKIEALTEENKKFQEINNNQSIILNKSLDEIEKGPSIKTQIDKLKEEKKYLLEKLSGKENVFFEENQKLKEENKILLYRLNEVQKKYEELEDQYKQKLAQFKKEITAIKMNASEIESLKEKIRSMESNSALEMEKNQKAISSKNLEIQSYKQRLENLEKSQNAGLQIRKSESDQSKLMVSPLQRTSSIMKHNWEEFEEKINNLVSENERLAERPSSNYLLNNGDTKTDTQFMKLNQENFSLKKNIEELTLDNEQIKTKLIQFERRFENMTNDNEMDFKLKEQNLRKNFEQTLKGLEEQKEKNIIKVSKENHELKQHNDELKQTIENFQKQRTVPIDKRIDTKTEKPIITTSPILIINEMLTPCTSKLPIKSTIEDPKSIKKVSMDANKRPIISNSPSASSPFENLNKFNSANKGDTYQNYQNNQNQKFVAKNYGINLKEACVKEISLKESNIRDSNVSFREVNDGKSEKSNNETKDNYKFEFPMGFKGEMKQNGNYLGNLKMDGKKETKIISFNLTGDRGKGK